MLSNGYILILIWVGVIAALAVMAPEWMCRTELVNGEKSAEGDSAFCRYGGIIAGDMDRIGEYVGMLGFIFKLLEKCHYHF